MFLVENRLLAITFAVIFVICLGACNSFQSQSDKNYQKVRKLVSNEKYEEAIKICDQKLKTANLKYRWFGLRASAELGKQDFAKAYEDFKKAIEGNEKINWYYADLGYVCISLRKNDEAVKHCSTVIENSKSDRDKEIAYDTRALAYKNLGKFDEAIDDISKAIEINPKNVGLYAHRAYIYNEMYELDKAIEDANKAIEMDSQSLISYSSRANVYLNKGEYQKALKDVQKCLSINDKDFGAYEQLTLIYDLTEKPQKALDAANKLIELYPNKSNAYGNRALLYISRGEIDKAEKDTDKSFELDPESTYGLACKCVIYSIKGEGDKAVALQSKLEAINLLKAKSYLCLAYISLKQYDEVIKLAKEMIVIAPRKATAYRYLSEAYRETGKNDLAQENMKKALELGYSQEQFTEIILNQIKKGSS